MEQKFLEIVYKERILCSHAFGKFGASLVSVHTSEANSADLADEGFILWTWVAHRISCGVRKPRSETKYVDRCPKLCCRTDLRKTPLRPPLGTGTLACATSATNIRCCLENSHPCSLWKQMETAATILTRGSAEPLLLCITSVGSKAWGNASSWQSEVMCPHLRSREAGQCESATFGCWTGKQPLLHNTGNPHTWEGRADAEWPQRMTTALPLGS